MSRHILGAVLKLLSVCVCVCVCVCVAEPEGRGHTCSRLKLSPHSQATCTELEYKEEKKKMLKSTLVRYEML